jgi:GT2 family glycosyltransferase
VATTYLEMSGGAPGKKSNMTRTSLIMATAGRAEEITRLLDSLAAQTDQDFELLVVDQNSDDRLVSVLDPYRKQFPIMHLSSKRGLSRARNVGIERARGKIMAFPDDDCWYPPWLLESVARYLHEHPDIDGVTGRILDEFGTSFARFDPSPGLLRSSNVWRRASSACTFLRNSVVQRVGGFDETLGVGAGTPWGGGEDIDYPLRVIEAGFKVYYDPGIVVFHPNPLRHGYRKAARRAYSYGAGIGRVWRKHDYPVRLVGYYLLRPLGGVVLALLSGQTNKARYHWGAFRGRLRGWLSKR